MGILGFVVVLMVNIMVSNGIVLGSINGTLSGWWELIWDAIKSYWNKTNYINELYHGFNSSWFIIIAGCILCTFFSVQQLWCTNIV